MPTSTVPALWYGIDDPSEAALLDCKHNVTSIPTDRFLNNKLLQDSRDHLLLPTDPLSSDLKIPYVAIPYDGLPFLTYPVRLGYTSWPDLYSNPEALDASISTCIPPLATRLRECFFFQTWLLFGHSPNNWRFKFSIASLYQLFVSSTTPAFQTLGIDRPEFL